MKKIYALLLVIAATFMFAQGALSQNKAADIDPSGTIMEPGIYIPSGINLPLATLFDNGPVFNSTGTGSGGANESIYYQGGTGTYGSGCQYSSGIYLADDFTISCNNWTVTSIDFYIYQTNSGTTSTITGIYVRIWNGRPGETGSEIIWGDMTTNVMASTTFTNIYRVLTANGGVARPIMKVVANTPGLSLDAGTYWVEWGCTGSLTSGPWNSPVVTSENVTGNAIQTVDYGVNYNDVLYNSYAQGMPFVMYGNVTVVYPVPTITGTTDPCVNSGYYTYSTEPGMSNYIWSVSSGGTIVSGAGTNEIQVSWFTAGPQMVSVTYTDACGNQALTPTVLNVTVIDIPEAAGPITGYAEVCTGAMGVPYWVAPVPGAVSYVWTLPPGATIASGEWTQSITVDYAWDATSGMMNVYGNNLCGNGIPSPNYYVNLTLSPPAPTITLVDDVLHSSSSSGNQWYLDGVAIPWATGQTYTPVNSGVYTCKITQDLCTSPPSNEILYIMAGVFENGIDASVSISPNPCKGLFTLQIIPINQKVFTIQIFNNVGAMIYELTTGELKGTFEKVIDLRPAANGIYNVMIRSNSSQIVKKILVSQ